MTKLTRRCSRVDRNNNKVNVEGTRLHMAAGMGGHSWLIMATPSDAGRYRGEAFVDLPHSAERCVAYERMKYSRNRRFGRPH